MPLICLRAPPLDPVTRKALALPLINPLSPHGRVFFFSWFGFWSSFLAWYALSSLLSVTIRNDLNLSQNEIQNSNIIAGTASLIVRMAAGVLCERFGPRKVFVAILWAAALPTGLAGTAQNAGGLYAIRFFVGLAGGAFVPAQAWVVQWFDKSVMGTSTAFSAGWGDSGVGFTFLIMPAIFDSFLADHSHSARVAWRLTFVIPCLLLVVVGLACLLLCDDTPTGAWADRLIPSPSGTPIDTPANDSRDNFIRSSNSSRTCINTQGALNPDEKEAEKQRAWAHAEEARGRRGSATSDASLESGTSHMTASSATSTVPTFREGLSDLCCPATFLLAAAYFAAFGSCLSLNSFLLPFYLEHFPDWTQTRASTVTAAFGLMNLVTRPAGGLVADMLYRWAGERRGLDAKKYWICFLVIVQGAFLVWIGLVNSSSPALLIGSLAGAGIFMQAANGATYALLPHVNPHVNGLMGGTVGSSGNLGGVVFSTVARYSSYARTIWIVGATGIAVGVALAFINPLPKRQRAAVAHL